MDFGKAFSFVFEDEGWVSKILIGGLIMLIPIVGVLVVLGWSLEIGRRVVTGESPTLPDWSDFGAYLMRGIKGAVVGFIYALPVFLLEACPLMLTALAGGGNGGGHNALGALATMVSLLIGCVVFIYVIFMAFAMPAALMRFTMEGDNIGAGLAFGEVFGMVKDNLGAYFIVVLGALVAGFIGSLGGIIIIGIIFTMPYAYAIQGHLYGQAYAEATGSTAAGSIPPAAPAAPSDWNG